MVVKGIMAAAETDRALDGKADAAIVSNRCVRLLDSGPGAIRTLPKVVSGVDGSVQC